MLLVGDFKELIIFFESQFLYLKNGDNINNNQNNTYLLD